MSELCTRKPLHYTFFSETEFNKLTPSCSLNQMNREFMERLDLARRLAGIPFVLNCAYRSSEWDKSKGRSGMSYHCLGRAVDIRCNDSTNRFKIIYALLNAGFTSIGIYKRFIHVDDRIVDDRTIWIGDLDVFLEE